MDLNQLALLAVLACGAFAVFITLPLAKAIPAQLERQWRHDLEAYGAGGGQSESPPSYPLPQSILVVLLGMVLGGVAMKAYGPTAEGAAICVLLASLLLMTTINVKTALLPDMVVYPALWAGLLFHAYKGDAADSIFGAATVFLIPYAIYMVVRAASRKEIFGFGDLKSFALAGAWLGVASAPYVLGGFVVSLLAYSVAIRLFARNSFSLVPTGPAHLTASLTFIVGTRLL